MAYVTPASEVYLIKNCPLDIGREHTIKFATANAQQTYFQSNQRATHHWGDYVRINPLDNVIRLGLDYASVYQCNYVAFRNAATLYEQKWYYAFIVECNYINEGTTEIVYSLDYMQTYLFDFEMSPCMIEREHTKTDTVGGNIVPEGLDIGEYVLNNSHYNGSTLLNVNGYIPCHMGDEMVYIVISSIDIFKSINAGYVKRDIDDYYNVGGVYNGVGVYVFVNATYLGDFLKLAEGLSDAFAAIFPFPAALISWDCVHYANYGVFSSSAFDGIGRLYDDNGHKSVIERDLQSAVSYTYPTFNSSTPSTPTQHTVIVRASLTIPLFNSSLIDNYRPWNNKLYTAPYCWVCIDTKNGQQQLYRPEFFSTRINFGFLVSPSAEPNIFAYPLYYRRADKNYEEGVVKNNAYPYSAWNYDNYKTWLAQNSMGLALSFAQGMISGGFGAMSSAMGRSSISTFEKMVEGEIPQVVQKRNAKNQFTRGWEVKTTPIHMNESSTREVQYRNNPAETALRGTSGMLSAAGVLGNIADHAMIPDTVKGQINNGDINIAADMNDFYVYIKTVRIDYAQKIDDFFSRYGYAVNRFGLPNVLDTNGTPRRRWNYVKTVDCKVHGKSPVGFNHDVEENLEAIFDHGITFWNISNGAMYDYTQTNNDNNKPTS